MRLPMNEKTEHKIYCTFKRKVIVPLVGITKNIDFFLNKGDRFVIFADGTRAKVTNAYEKHICELEKEIGEIYNVTPWVFLQRWYKGHKNLDSCHFVIITLEEIENGK